MYSAFVYDLLSNLSANADHSEATGYACRLFLLNRKLRKDLVNAGTPFNNKSPQLKGREQKFILDGNELTDVKAGLAWLKTNWVLLPDGVRINGSGEVVVTADHKRGELIVYLEGDYVATGSDVYSFVPPSRLVVVVVVVVSSAQSFSDIICRFSTVSVS
jgi:hypothetical protein